MISNLTYEEKAYSLYCLAFLQYWCRFSSCESHLSALMGLMEAKGHFHQGVARGYYGLKGLREYRLSAIA
ncbi:hypothetical protein EXA13_01975 [Vibrio cincinnatiensis]|nr:hypothetical protein [Vibrio cincinnatiensis]